MEYLKFTDDVSRETFNQTKNWEVEDWKNFRKSYYKDYFSEKDKLTNNIIEKKQDAHKEMFYFKLKKLENIKKYNKIR